MNIAEGSGQEDAKRMNDGGRFLGLFERFRELLERFREKSWIERLARFGLATKGFVYIMIGVLAVQVSLGLREKVAGARGALGVIADEPSGQVILGVVAVGLAGYVLWRAVQAVLDPEGKGWSLRGIAKRISYALSGAAYALLAYAALCLAAGAAVARNDHQARDWAARFLDWPLGPWLVGLTGLGILGLGIGTMYGAYHARFREKLHPGALTGKAGTWVTWSGRIGLAARAIVFGLIGSFLIRAALESNPRRVRDLDGALQVLAWQPYGTPILFTVAAGLAVYGAYLLVEARFRRIP